MGRLKVTSFIFALLVTSLSCADDHDDSKEVSVDVYESTIPTTGTINQDIQIQLKAQAPNGCYSDLEIELIELGNKQFLLKGTALFRTSGICPDVMVYADTVINFKPASAGVYSFQVNEAPFDIRSYSVEIN